LLIENERLFMSLSFLIVNSFSNEWSKAGEGRKYSYFLHLARSLSALGRIVSREDFTLSQQAAAAQGFNSLSCFLPEVNAACALAVWTGSVAPH
jgi:hypothetical protein